MNGRTSTSTSSPRSELAAVKSEKTDDVPRTTMYASRHRAQTFTVSFTFSREMYVNLFQRHFKNEVIHESNKFKGSTRYLLGKVVAPDMVAHTQ